MKKSLAMLTAIFICLPMTVNAQYGSSNNTQCFGSDSFKTCTDYNNGNHYQIQKIGNSTLVNGSNYNNGSSWSQQSTKIGNSTIHTGNAANGNYWNITEQNIGGTKHIIGTDSKGNSVNCMVSQFINTCN